MVTRPDTPPRPTIRPQGATRYSIGDPTGEEQLYLEYINRARANPAAEGVLLAGAGADYPEVQSAYDFFGVDLVKMMNEFAAIDPAPPLSFNELLIEAARLHTQDMLDNVFQGHDSWDPATDAPDTTKDVGYRLDQVNYPANRFGENVYSFAKAPFDGHAGFEVDWGPSPDGMQVGRGHRVSIHNPDYREVGIGVLNGSNQADGPPPRDVGPQLVTQDFGSRSGLDPFITGVAYYDLNGNGFYDVGEGIGGATVDVAGSQFHAVTVNSGGYAVPVPPNMSHTVMFSGPGFAEDTQTTVVGTDNVKVDYRMVYQPPTISGPGVLGVGQAGEYGFTPVGGATTYRWSQALLAPHTEVEGAENGSAHLQVTITPGYNVIDSSTRASGAASFHLATPEPETQTLDLNMDLQPGSQAQLMFASRLGWATANQVARTQVSNDGGASWSELWSRAGTGDDGQNSFETVTTSLTAYDGQVIRVRFQYTVSGGYFPQTDSGVGWNFDDIRFDDVARLEQGVAPEEVTGTSFSFSASREGTYLLRTQPYVSGRWLPAGPETLVDVSGSVPQVVTIDTITAAPGGGLRIEFNVANGPPLAIRLNTSDDLPPSWAEDTGAQVDVIEAGVRYGFEVPLGTAGQRFYQVVIE
jgi:uncharacterized protein YkwD